MRVRNIEDAHDVLEVKSFIYLIVYLFLNIVNGFITS